MWVAGTLRQNNRQLGPFLNNMVENAYNNKNVGFFGVVMFIMIGYYLFFCTVQGNIKVGLRFFSFTFYPLVP